MAQTQENQEIDESADPWNPDGQDQWYCMLEDGGRRLQLERIYAALPHMPESVRKAVSLVQEGLSWHEAAQVVYGTKTNAGGSRIQERLRVHMERIERIQKALKQRERGIPLAHLVRILRLERHGKNSKVLVHRYLKTWREFYGL